MEQFFNHDFDITYIKQSTYFPLGSICDSVHKNRPFHGLIIYDEGKRYFDFSGGPKILNKGHEILYIPKGTNYIVDPISPSAFYAINFDMSSEVSFKPFSIPVKNPTIFLDLFKKMSNEWKKRRPFYKSNCMSYLYKIIYLTCLEYQNKYHSSKLNTILEPALEYIRSEYTNENISIPHLATLCGISEAYFRRIFMKTQMLSPIKYINNLRLMRAKELLSVDSYNISTVASLSGFQNDAYFSREFKKAYGISPSEFKNNSSL